MLLQVKFLKHLSTVYRVKFLNAEFIPWSLLDIPDDDNLSKGEVDIVHLSNKDGAHSFIEGCSVHVYRRSDREDEAGHATVDV